MTRLIAPLLTLALVSILTTPALAKPAPHLGPDTMKMVRMSGHDMLSLNWSGYEVGGRITEVRGTFTVPYPLGGAGWEAEWVGVDGYNNDDLIQAGVSMDAIEGTREFPGYTMTECWWEILPSSSVNVSLPCNPGDVVTVGIRYESSGEWEITILNDTTLQSFHQQFPYGGPAHNAEWVVEAPTVFGTIANLMPFTPITWTDLGVQGHGIGQFNDMWLIQNGKVVSVPSQVGSARQLMDRGFTVVYP